MSSARRVLRNLWKECLKFKIKVGGSCRAEVDIANSNCRIGDGEGGHKEKKVWGQYSNLIWQSLYFSASKACREQIQCPQYIFIMSSRTVKGPSLSLSRIAAGQNKRYVKGPQEGGEGVQTVMAGPAGICMTPFPNPPSPLPKKLQLTQLKVLFLYQDFPSCWLWDRTADHCNFVQRIYTEVMKAGLNFMYRRHTLCTLQFSVDF
jgi:hypothetical protein